MWIVSGVVVKSIRHKCASFPDRIVCVVHGLLLRGGHDHKVVRKLQRLIVEIRRAHHLMQLLPGADADDLDRQPRRNRLRKIGNPHRRYLRNEDFAALHALKIF